VARGQQWLLLLLRASRWDVEPGNDGATCYRTRHPSRQSLCGLDEENWGEWNKMEGRVSLE
jgi:hypothetical protein